MAMQKRKHSGKKQRRNNSNLDELCRLGNLSPDLLELVTQVDETDDPDATNDPVIVITADELIQWEQRRPKFEARWTDSGLEFAVRGRIHPKKWHAILITIISSLPVWFPACAPYVEALWAAVAR